MSELIGKSSKYKALIKDLRATMATAQKKAQESLNQIRLHAYWHMGHQMNLLDATLPSVESESLAKNLSEDLNLDQSLIYRIMQFHKTWPDGPPALDGNFLSWAHHIRLLSIKDENKRDFYLEQATKNSWGRDTLRTAIKNKLYESTLKGGKDVPSLKRDANPLYIYKAIVEKVVDGDTLEVRIDLGFHTWSQQRLRLRGINTQELSADDQEAKALALKAKTYVEEKLTNIPFIVVKTYKTDIYGRFVADVFFHPTLKDKVQVATAGFFLNEEILKAGVGIAEY